MCVAAAMRRPRGRARPASGAGCRSRRRSSCSIRPRIQLAAAPGSARPAASARTDSGGKARAGHARELVAVDLVFGDVQRQDGPAQAIHGHARDAVEAVGAPDHRAQHPSSTPSIFITSCRCRAGRRAWLAPAGQRMRARHEHALGHAAQIPLGESWTRIAPVEMAAQAGAAGRHVVGDLGRRAVELGQFQRRKAFGDFLGQIGQHQRRQRLVQRHRQARLLARGEGQRTLLQTIGLPQQFQRFLQQHFAGRRQRGIAARTIEQFHARSASSRPTAVLTADCACPAGARPPRTNLGGAAAKCLSCSNVQFMIRPIHPLSRWILTFQSNGRSIIRARNPALAASPAASPLAIPGSIR